MATVGNDGDIVYPGIPNIDVENPSFFGEFLPELSGVITTVPGLSKLCCQMQLSTYDMSKDIFLQSTQAGAKPSSAWQIHFIQ